MYDKSWALDIMYLDLQKAVEKLTDKRLVAKVRNLCIMDEVGD